MNKKQSWFFSLNKNDQIASVLSALWIAIVILVVIPYNGDGLGGSLEDLLWWGRLPFIFVLGSALLGQKVVLGQTLGFF